MPLELLYGASPNDLSHTIARDIIRRRAAAGTFHWITSSEKSLQACQVILCKEAANHEAAYREHLSSATTFLRGLCNPFLKGRLPLSWIEALELLRKILGKTLPLSSLERVGHLLSSCKKNLVFAARDDDGVKPYLPPFLKAPVAPFSLPLVELYRAYQAELDQRGLYDNGDLWELSYKLVRTRRLPLPTSGHILYWDRFFYLSPGQRLWLKTLRASYPELALVVTSPFSASDEEDPFFTAAFAEIGELSDHSTVLDTPPPPSSKHVEFDSSYDLLLALRAEAGNSPIAVIDRLPRLEKEVFVRPLGCTPLETPSSLSDIPSKEGFSEEDRTLRDDLLYRLEREWREGVEKHLRPGILLESLEEAYIGGSHAIFIPYFQANVFPPSTPLSLEGLAVEPMNREWEEILETSLFLYWQDRVLLRLLHTRFEGACTLLSAKRDLKGNELAPSCFARDYPINMSAEARVAPEGGLPIAHNKPSGPLPELSSFSVAQLDLFSQCPFRFWMEVVMGLKAPEEEGNLSPALRGSVIHRLLEVAVAENLPFAALWTMLEGEFAPTLRRLSAIATAELKEQAERCHAHVTGHRVDARWQTLAVEWNFKWTVADAQPFTLRGRVDRILVHPESGHVVVVDYKTGDYLPSVQDMLAGGALQLPLYLSACRELLATSNPAGGALYWNLADGELKIGVLCDEVETDAFDISSRTQAKTKLSREALEDWQRAAVDKAKAVVARIRAGDFDPAPADTGFCKRACAWKWSCGYAWMGNKNVLGTDMKDTGGRDAACG